ncbi:MAG: lipoyl(octanoyl) transferase LipB [Phycisphaerales bacterium]
MSLTPTFIDLGPTPYAPAYAEQLRRVDEVLASRERAKEGGGTPEVGRVLLVEHVPPVITVSRRAGSADHLLASRDTLAKMGIELHETDRGGDITYHGPGQLVVYPILDLNVLGLGLHAYMRMLEEVVIRVLARFGVKGVRDASATGVWVGTLPTNGTPTVREGLRADAPGSDSTPRGRGIGEKPLPDGRGSVDAAASAKVCAMGVRVKRWVSMHGLALNVTTNLEHFGLIVPCGLVGRPVTSLQNLLGGSSPPMDEVKRVMVEEFAAAVGEAAQLAGESRLGEPTYLGPTHGEPGP